MFFESCPGPRLLISVVQAWRVHCDHEHFGPQARRGLARFVLAACRGQRKPLRQLFAPDLNQWMSGDTPDKLMAMEIIAQCLPGLGGFQRCMCTLSYVVHPTFNDAVRGPKIGRGRSTCRKVSKLLQSWSHIRDVHTPRKKCC